MSRSRTFDNGKISVTFRTEEDAKAFDTYLETETTWYMDGKEIGRSKPKDDFDPYKFFGIRKDGEAE